MEASVDRPPPAHNRQVQPSKRLRLAKRLSPVRLRSTMSLRIVESKKRAAITRNRAPSPVPLLPRPRWCPFRRRILPLSRQMLRTTSAWSYTVETDKATSRTHHIPPVTIVIPIGTESTPTVARFTVLPRPLPQVYHQPPLFHRSIRTITRRYKHRLHPPPTHQQP